VAPSLLVASMDDDAVTDSHFTSPSLMNGRSKLRWIRLPASGTIRRPSFELPAQAPQAACPPDEESSREERPLTYLPVAALRRVPLRDAGPVAAPVVGGHSAPDDASSAELPNVCAPDAVAKSQLPELAISPDLIFTRLDREAGMDPLRSKVCRPRREAGEDVLRPTFVL